MSYAAGALVLAWIAIALLTLVVTSILRRLSVGLPAQVTSVAAGGENAPHSDIPTPRVTIHVRTEEPSSLIALEELSRLNRSESSLPIIVAFRGDPPVEIPGVRYVVDHRITLPGQPVGLLHDGSAAPVLYARLDLPGAFRAFMKAADSIVVTDSR